MSIGAPPFPAVLWVMGVVSFTTHLLHLKQALLVRCLAVLISGEYLMNNGQTVFPFRKDQNYGIAWINMLLVFHELSLQCGAMLCSLSIKFSHISLLSFCSCPIAALEF